MSEKKMPSSRPEMTPELREYILQKHYDGDRDRQRRAINRGRRDARSWDDVVAAATVLPELAEEAHKQLFLRLGFLPDEALLVRFGPYVRGLLEAKQTQNMGEAAFEQAVDDVARDVRDAFMVADGWLDFGTYDPIMLMAYEEYLPQFQEQARRRVIRSCGYAPKVEHSLEPELYLRNLFSNDNFYKDAPMGPIDYMLASVVRYRQAYFTGRIKAAHALPLHGQQAFE